MTDVISEPLVRQPVGCQEDAQTITEYYHGSTGAGLPDGWSKLGDGSYRRVFMSPSGTVYKLGHDYYLNWMQLQEVVFFHLHADQDWAPPVSLWVTEMHGIEIGVVAMPRVQVCRDIDAYHRLENEIGYAAGAGKHILDDICGYNFGWLDGVPVVIDAGNLSSLGARQVWDVIDQLREAGWVAGTSGSWMRDRH